MQVVAFHGHGSVEIDLHGVGDALFDAELLSFVATIPALKLGDGKEGRDDY